MRVLSAEARRVPVNGEVVRLPTKAPTAERKGAAGRKSPSWEACSKPSPSGGSSRSSSKVVERRFSERGPTPPAQKKTEAGATSPSPQASDPRPSYVDARSEEEHRIFGDYTARSSVIGVTPKQERTSEEAPDGDDDVRRSLGEHLLSLLSPRHYPAATQQQEEDGEGRTYPKASRGQEESGYVCPVCHESFKSKRSFNSHIIIHCQVIG